MLAIAAKGLAAKMLDPGLRFSRSPRLRLPLGATLRDGERCWFSAVRSPGGAGDPFGVAVVAFSGYRDGAVTESAYQGIYVAYRQFKRGFGPFTVRAQYTPGYGPNTPPVAGVTPG